MNELADGHQFVAITRRINGGTNGLADRQMYYERAKSVHGADIGVARDAPLARGHEAIVARARKRAKANATKRKAPAKR